MKRSERVRRWFSIMKALEKQMGQVALMKNTVDELDAEAVSEKLYMAILEVDQTLSTKYGT